MECGFAYTPTSCDVEQEIAADQEMMHGQQPPPEMEEQVSVCGEESLGGEGGEESGEYDEYVWILWGGFGANDGNGAEAGSNNHPASGFYGLGRSCDNSEWCYDGCAGV